MNEHTQSNPGCYHGMIKYLAELENTDFTKTLIFNTPEEAKGIGKNYKKSFIYGDNKLTGPHKQQIKGGAYVIKFENEEIIPCEIIPDRVEVVTIKSPKDFSIQLNPEGQYADSLGGGWTQKVQMYSINEKFFAYMDCSCEQY